MQAPRHIFLDTSIFDGQQFNFSSQAFTALVDVARESHLTLLVPKNIEAEILRHISERSAEAAVTLGSARRKAPLLARWSKWPRSEDEATVQDDLNTIGQADYRRFQENFTVVMLDYSGIEFNELMAWYEEPRAPFSTGKKRKEFPDAIAMLSLLAYARSRKAKIAIVSSDNDFRDACAHHDEVIYFNSITSLTESLLGEESLVRRTRALVSENHDAIVAAVVEEFPCLKFFPAANPDGKAADIAVENAVLANFNVLEVDEHGATVAFDASISYSAWLNFMEPSSLRRSDAGTPYYLQARRGTVHDTIALSGILHLAFWSDDPGEIDIGSVQFSISECAVNGLPSIDDDW